jgi:hypothetical protein
MDLVAFFIGAVTGLIVAFVAVEFGLKKLFAAPEHTKLTSLWSFREFTRPLIATLDATQAPIPRGARMVTSGPVPAPGSGIQARVSHEVKGEFVVDAEQDRALLLMGGLRPGSLAMITVDPKLVGTLRAEYERLWTNSREHVSRVKVGDVASRTNQVVETRGTIADVIPSGDTFLARLQDGSSAIGVRLTESLDRGAVVTVTGRVVKGPAGVPLIEALEVTR